VKNVLRRAAGTPSGVLPLPLPLCRSRENSICLLKSLGVENLIPFGFFEHQLLLNCLFSAL